MHQRHNDSSQNGAGAEGLFEMLFAAIWFIVSYLPFVLIAAIVGVTFFKYVHLSHFVSAIIGFAAGFVCLCGIKALDRLARRLESRMSIWHLPVKAVVVAFVAGPPFALGYALGASFVAERSILEKLIAGGFVGLVIAGPAYYRVIHDEH